MIQEHIHNLLFEHDCVIIPDFGGLITRYEPARIHPVRHIFLPPSKRVAFNEKLKLNDGLLISTFAYDHKITAEEAQQQVSTFVHQLQQELQATKRFELRGIGLFRLNAEQKIEFEYISNSNFLHDSFGLPELVSRPVMAPDAAAGLRTLLREQQAGRTVSTAKPSLRRKLRKIYDTAAVMAIAGLSCSALYFISLQTDYHLSSLNPFSLFGQHSRVERAARIPAAQQPVFPEKQQPYAAQPAEKVPVVTAERKTAVEAPAVASLPESASENAGPAAAPAVKAVKKAPAKAVAEIAKTPEKGPEKTSAALAATKKSSALTIKEATNRYYIIAGGYSSLKNAKWGLKQLTGQNGQGKVILPTAEGELHRVSVRDFASKEEALAQLPELKKEYGNNIWILNY